MTSELWDVETGNMIGRFEAEAAALLVVRDLLEVNGRDYANALDLGWEDEAEQSGSIATGRALLDRVARLAPERDRVAASGIG